MSSDGQQAQQVTPHEDLQTQEEQPTEASTETALIPEGETLEVMEFSEDTTVALPGDLIPKENEETAAAAEAVLGIDTESPIFDKVVDEQQPDTPDVIFGK